MKKLHRSTTHRLWKGVFGGIGEYANVDPNIVRILFILLVIATGVFPCVIAYIIAIFIIPEKTHTIL